MRREDRWFGFCFIFLFYCKKKKNVVGFGKRRKREKMTWWSKRVGVMMFIIWCRGNVGILPGFGEEMTGLPPLA